MEDAIRPTHVEISLGTIAQNYDAIRVHVGNAAVMPVVKANAYGHGIVMNFLGLGGATGKVITASKVPVLLAH